MSDVGGMGQRRWARELSGDHKINACPPKIKRKSHRDTHLILPVLSNPARHPERLTKATFTLDNSVSMHKPFESIINPEIIPVDRVGIHSEAVR